MFFLVACDSGWRCLCLFADKFWAHFLLIFCSLTALTVRYCLQTIPGCHFFQEEQPHVSVQPQCLNLGEEFVFRDFLRVLKAIQETMARITVSHLSHFQRHLTSLKK